MAALKDRILAARAEAQRARDDPFNGTGGGGSATSSVFVRHEAYSYPTSAQAEASLAKAAKLDESIVELQGQLPAAREKAEVDKAVLDKVRDWLRSDCLRSNFLGRHLLKPSLYLFLYAFNSLLNFSPSYSSCLNACIHQAVARLRDKEAVKELGKDALREQV